MMLHIYNDVKYERTWYHIFVLEMPADLLQ
jgi:hypothetical protein